MKIVERYDILTQRELATKPVTTLRKKVKAFKILGHTVPAYSKLTKEELIDLLLHLDSEVEAKFNEQVLAKVWHNWFQGMPMFQIQADYMDTYIQENQQEATLFRGGMYPESFLASGSVKFNGISSWTTEKDIAQEFANDTYKTTDKCEWNAVPMLFMVQAKSNHAPIHHLTSDEFYKRQQEWLSASSVEYKVIKVEDGVVFLEQI